MNPLINQVQLIGHLGHEPEMMSFPSGSNMVKLRIATNESYRKKDGTYDDIVQWHTVSAWGKLAERMVTNLHRGQKVMIKGKLENRKWQDKDGNDRFATQVKAIYFAPLSPKVKKDSEEQPMPF